VATVLVVDDAFSETVARGAGCRAHAEGIELELVGPRAGSTSGDDEHGARRVPAERRG
jgi:hypothetical protein